ncbi:hypothetical protein [Streptomyces mirabilis]|uniref:Uncharacterized protein n=1 Tax=Streptomyces mirabilis TaxID=68239 RepID=A0ABU3V4Y2_9ACTN|nr:hypothetical protein [Streptomyces mirabilis]MCX5355581.1 hypothetical protein [Streptomyces mirabilis]MDU9001227.1 hypothetical protein [Streptomyces mirabilis]
MTVGNDRPHIDAADAQGMQIGDGGTSNQNNNWFVRQTGAIR